MTSATERLRALLDERGNFICRAEVEGSFLSKDEVKALAKYVSGVLAENAKLRELVRYAYECAIHSSHATCDECKEWNSGCILADRMRELGIEVDA